MTDQTTTIPAKTKWRIFHRGGGFDDYPWILQKPSGHRWYYNDWDHAYKWLMFYLTNPAFTVIEWLPKN